MTKTRVAQKGTDHTVSVSPEVTQFFKLHHANAKTANELQAYAHRLEDQAKQIREAAACLMGERDVNHL